MSSIFLPRCVLDYINPFTKITYVQASSPYLLGVVPHSFLRVCLRATGLSKCPNKCLSKCPNKWNSQVSQLVCIFFSPFSEGSFILNCLLYTQLCVFATLSGLLPLSQELLHVRFLLEPYPTSFVSLGQNLAHVKSSINDQINRWMALVEPWEKTSDEQKKT